MRCFTDSIALTESIQPIGVLIKNIKVSTKSGYSSDSIDLQLPVLLVSKFDDADISMWLALFVQVLAV